MCQAAVGVVGDLCRAIGAQILPYTDDLLVILLENLGVSSRFFLESTNIT